MNIHNPHLKQLEKKDHSERALSINWLANCLKGVTVELFQVWIS